MSHTLSFPLNIQADISPNVDIDTYHTHVKQTLLEQYIHPLYTEPNNPPQLGGQQVSPDTLADAIEYIWRDNQIDRELEEELETLYANQMGVTANPLFNTEHMLVANLMTELNLPLPELGKQIIRYTAQTDVIPASNDWLDNPGDKYTRETFIASLGGYLLSERNADHRVVAFADHHAFDAFTADLTQRATQLASDQITQDKLTEFSDLTLKDQLTDGILLDQDNGYLPGSFSRIITQTINEFQNNHLDTVLNIPVNVKECLYAPTSIVFVNVEALTQGKPKDISADWQAIKQSKKKALQMNLLRSDTINKLKAYKSTTRYQKTTTTEYLQKTDEQYKRNPAFADQPLSRTDITRLITQAVKQHKTHQVTSNTYKKRQKTFNRPNRREPLNPTRPGVTHKTYYHPDIHIYLDTSGSVLESMYQESIIALIHLAKTLNTTIYFNSFSHILSETTRIQPGRKSPKQLYKMIQSIPKVGGGTEYTNVWKHINHLNFDHHLSFIITDFEYPVNRQTTFQPGEKHLTHAYYVPLLTDAYRWKELRQYAKTFQEAMHHTGHKNIRKFMLL